MSYASLNGRQQPRWRQYLKPYEPSADNTHPLPKPSGIRALYRHLRDVRNASIDFARPNGGRPLACRIVFLIALLTLLLIALGTMFVCVLTGCRKHSLPFTVYLSGMPHVTKDPDRDALVEIRRLYDVMLKTEADRDRRAMSEFLRTYKYSLDKRSRKRKRGADTNDGGVYDSKGKSDGGTKVSETLNLTSRVAGADAGVLSDLRRIIKDIEILDPDDGLYRAAVFLRAQLGLGNDANGDGHPNGQESVRNTERKEVEAFEPFDDILYLQFLSSFAKRENTSTAPSTDYLWWRRKRAVVPSVTMGRFYYPLRRFHGMQPFSPETASTASAWFDTMALDYFGDVVEPLETSLRQSSDLQRSLKRSTGILQGLQTSGRAAFSPIASQLHTASIFISVASFRDMECQPMLQQAIDRATNVFRVYFGVAEQHNELDLPCTPHNFWGPIPCLASRGSAEVPSSKTLFDGAVCFPLDNVRLRHISPSVAYGPTYGRYMAMLLYRGEDYVFVLDSHSRFVYAWDSRTVAMYMEMRHPRLVLSHYPEAFQKQEPNFAYERTSTAYLCRASFIEADGYVRLAGTIVSREAAAKTFRWRHVLSYGVRGSRFTADMEEMRPLAQPWAAGGFLFADASVIRDVPFDPHLPNTFDGEEALYSVRLWTHGYDIYSPNRNVCYHIYSRNDQPKVWDSNPLWYTLRLFSRSRIQCLLQSRVKGEVTLRVPLNTTDPAVTVDVDRYGVGRVRTVENWYRFAGLDPVRYTFDGRWCGRAKG